MARKQTRFSNGNNSQPLPERGPGTKLFYFKSRDRFLFVTSKLIEFLIVNDNLSVEIRIRC